MKKILVLDWDDVVSSTAAVNQASGEVFRAVGATPELIAQTYQSVKGGGFGYHVITHAREIATYLSIDPQPLIDQLLAAFSDTSRFIFPDARQFIEAAAGRGIPLGVLTAGDPWFQVHKIARSGLQGRFQMIEVVSGPDYIAEKVDRIRNFLERYEGAVMFDDRLPILERMASAWAEKLEPVFVNRKKEPAPPSGILAIASFADPALQSLIS